MEDLHSIINGIGFLGNRQIQLYQLVHPPANLLDMPVGELLVHFDQAVIPLPNGKFHFDLFDLIPAKHIIYRFYHGHDGCSDISLMSNIISYR